MNSKTERRTNEAKRPSCDRSLAQFATPIKQFSSLSHIITTTRLTFYSSCSSLCFLTGWGGYVCEVLFHYSEGPGLPSFDVFTVRLHVFHCLPEEQWRFTLLLGQESLKPHQLKRIVEDIAEASKKRKNLLKSINEV